SSRPGDVVMDPFLGSGTTAAVCTKLARNFVGFEIDRTYCLLTLKRIAMAKVDKVIQGYSDSVFWERNTLAEQLRAAERANTQNDKAYPQSFLQTSLNLHEAAYSKMPSPPVSQRFSEKSARKIGARSR